MKFLARKNSMYGMKGWRDESFGWKNKGCTDEKNKGWNIWDEKHWGCTDEKKKDEILSSFMTCEVLSRLADRQTNSLVLFVSLRTCSRKCRITKAGLPQPVVSYYQRMQRRSSTTLKEQFNTLADFQHTAATPHTDEFRHALLRVTWVLILVRVVLP